MKQIEQMNKEELKAFITTQQIALNQAKKEVRKAKSFSVCNENCKKSNNYHFNMRELTTEEILNSEKFKTYVMSATEESLLSKEATHIVNNQFKADYIAYVLTLIKADLKL